MKKILDKVQSIYIISVTAILLFILIMILFAKADCNIISEHSLYDSYTLQAMNWREGRIALDKNYPWLELAVLNDTYFSSHSMNDPEAYKEFFYDDEGNFIENEENEFYVSFPPFPSVPMYLLSFIFGENTPSAMISVIYAIGALIFAYLICRRFNYSYIYSICGALLLTVASSAFFLYVGYLSGSVWFMAQLLSLFLTTAAFYFIHGNKAWEYFLAFILLGFAVGCRPFQILYYFYFAYVLWKKYNYKFLKTIKFYLPAAIIGICYMAYNYVRFGSVMEFGHNYLPEMMLADEGQFSLYYITVNYSDMFFKLPEFVDGNLTFSMYSFACWITNVLFIILALALLLKLRNHLINSKKEKSEERINNTNVEIMILCVLIIVHFILTLMHKTLGMIQFGSRYTVDILPAVLVAVALVIKPISEKKKSTDKYVFNYIGLLCMISSGLLNISATYKYMLNNTVAYEENTINIFTLCILLSLVLFIIFIMFIFFIMPRKKAKEQILVE